MTLQTIDPVTKYNKEVRDMPKRAGRKTDAERAERKLEAERATRYAAQEAKRADPIQIDQRVTLATWIVAVGVGFVASAMISFNGITSVAPLVGLSAAWMSYLFFFFIEFLYLVFLVAYLLLASRNEKAVGALAGMWFFAGVAIAANGFHTFEYHNWDFLSVEAWAGVVLSVSAPIAILSVSKLASRVVFARVISVD